jgi:hypothetical protein
VLRPVVDGNAQATISDRKAEFHAFFTVAGYEARADGDVDLARRRRVEELGKGLEVLNGAAAAELLLDQVPQFDRIARIEPAARNHGERRIDVDADLEGWERWGIAVDREGRPGEARPGEARTGEASGDPKQDQDRLGRADVPG